MKMHRIIGNIYDIMIPLMATVGLIFMLVGIVCEIRISNKIIEQDNCIELNNKYYCEVK